MTFKEFKANYTDPKMVAIQEDKELDTATTAFFSGIRYTVLFLFFICFLISITVFLIAFPFEMCLYRSYVDKVLSCGIKFHSRPLSDNDITIIMKLVKVAQDIVIWIFTGLVLSYIFKGRGGSKFFEAIGNLIDRVSNFYKAKAMLKSGVISNDNEASKLHKDDNRDSKTERDSLSKQRGAKVL